MNTEHRNIRHSKPVLASQVVAQGTKLLDEHGQEVILKGINLIHKGNRTADGTFNFLPDWPEDLYKRFAQMGINAVRLGIIWAAIEPAPGEYDETYLTFIEHQLDLAAQAGISILLDMHQDLYAQRFSDGAPDWAVLTDAPYEATELWSDAYLFSPAVQHSWDAFWQNQAVPQTGKGLQDHYADTWAMLAQRFHGHPALFAYDIMNEPAPGSEIQQMFGLVLSNILALITPEEAKNLGLADADIETMMAAFQNPETKLQVLELLDDKERYRLLGQMSQEPVVQFERTVLEPFYEKITTTIREVDPGTFILRGNNYLSNIGVPSGIRPITVNGKQDDRQIFAPHGYDLVVDTPAMEMPSDSRAASIFARHRETQLGLNMPAIVTEWGAFAGYQSALSHGKFLKDLFAQYGWGDTYWCYTEDFFDIPAKELLTEE